MHQREIIRIQYGVINYLFINNEHFRLCPELSNGEHAFNSSLRGDVGSSCIAGFQHDRLSGRYKALEPLTSSTFLFI